MKKFISDFNALSKPLDNTPCTSSEVVSWRSFMNSSLVFTFFVGFLNYPRRQNLGCLNVTRLSQFTNSMSTQAQYHNLNVKTQLTIVTHEKLSKSHILKSLMQINRMWWNRKHYTVSRQAHAEFLHVFENTLKLEVELKKINFALNHMSLHNSFVFGFDFLLWALFG